jgi:hypothetical protein
MAIGSIFSFMCKLNGLYEKFLIIIVLGGYGPGQCCPLQVKYALNTVQNYSTEKWAKK